MTALLIQAEYSILWLDFLSQLFQDHTTRVHAVSVWLGGAINSGSLVMLS